MQLLKDFSVLSKSPKEVQSITSEAKDNRKDFFPVIYSTLDPQALSSLIEQNYNIKVSKNCQFWHRGLSDVYLVETLTKSYIFRISHHHWRSRSDIHFELNLLNFLGENNLPVSAPIKTQENNFYVEIDAPEGKRYSALFPFAPGNVPLGDLNINQSFLLGQTVAQLHQTSSKFSSFIQRKPLTLNYLLDDSLQIIAPFLQNKVCDLHYLIDAIAQLKDHIKNLPMEAPYWGICWGDPHSGNVHFTDENKITLFDFDQCGYGWRAFDIGKFLQVSLQSGLSRTVRDAFLKGYQTVETLSEIELSCLQALTQTAYIWSWAICLNTAQMHNYSRLDTFYFSHRLERLKRLKSADWQLF